MATGLLQRYGHVRGAENVDSYLNQPRDMGPKSSESSARKTLIEKEPEFLHREMLLVSLAFPFGIMMAFGGKPALLVLCFGALIAYIFDILGTIEGTLMAVLICGLGVWATLVLSARSMLSESIFNFPLVIVMGILLLMIFFVICAHFRSLLNEFATGFYLIEVLLFATIPILSSAIISWFLCVEIPSIDLSFCFSSVYFAYTLWLGMPRRSSHPSSFTSTSYEQTTVFILPRNVLIAVYAVPVLFTPLLHIALCHNVLVDSLSRLSGVIISFLFPLLLMMICLENHTGYWEEKDLDILLRRVSNVKMTCSAILFFLLQTHPMLDDLKKLSDLPASMSSAILCGIAVLMALVIYLHRTILIQFRAKRSQQADFTGARLEDMTGLYVFSSMCAGCCGALFAVFLGLSPLAIFLAFEGAMTANNFYRYSSSSKPKSLTDFSVTYGIPVLFMIFAARVVLFNFLYRTIVLTVFQLDFSLFPMSMLEFCSGLDQLVVFAVSVPTIVKALSDTLENRRPTDLLLPVGTSSNPSEKHLSNRILRFVLNILFPFLLIKFNIFVMVAELIVREQDWSSVNADREVVYSAHIFGGTALLLALTAVHLFRINRINLACTWSIIVVQGCKLLNLMSLPCQSILCCIFHLLCYTLPFAIHGEMVDTREGLNKRYDDSGGDAVTSSAGADGEAVSKSPVSVSAPSTAVRGGLQFTSKLIPMNIMLGLYLFLSFSSTVKVHEYLIHDILTAMLLRDPTDEQKVAASLALYFTFSGLLFLAFWRSATLFRSILFLCAAICTLIASQALPLTFQVDPNSPTYLVLSLHPELAESHEAVFLILSGLLLTAAALNIVPLKQPLSRLLFLFAFSYCAARTLLGWAFPLALNADSPHHGMLQLPWLLCSTTAFTASSVAIHSSITVKPKSKGKEDKDSTSSIISIGTVLFIIFSSIPFAALVFTLATKTSGANLLGILWTSAVSNGLLAVCVRSSELFREVKGRGAAGVDRRNMEINASTASMCVMTAMQGIGWTVGASLLTHSVSSDLTVPFSCLLILCIKRTMLTSNTHPVSLAATTASAWWLISGLYSIFVRGYANKVGISHFELNVGIFGEENVSIWNSSSLWYPLMNFILVLVPLPAICLGFLRRKGESEDILFILALFSVVPVLAAQCYSVKLLGIMGVIFGSWRCYDVGKKQSDSDKLI